jgi:Flp pilus assembly protein TadG
MRLTIAALRSKRNKRRNAGVAAVEFGLLAPTFVLVFAGTVTVGDAVAVQTQLDGAVAAGINYAIVNQSEVTSSTNSRTGNAYAVDLATRQQPSRTLCRPAPVARRRTSRWW